MLNQLIKKGFLAFLLLLPAVAQSALEALEDEELSEQTGAAISIGWQNLRFLAGPTTYLRGQGRLHPGAARPLEAG